MQIIGVALSVIGAVIIVEVFGYFWHRYAEHQGFLGSLIQSHHIKHHEHDYPIQKLRPKKQKYQSARSWSWYLLTVFLVLDAYFIVPKPYNLIMIVSGLMYAKFIINYLHSSFHIDNHWLSKNKTYQYIRKLHDIHHYGPFNYGILLFFMDRICGTFRKTLPTKKLNNF